jgi:ABC-type uncharacterized transport system ATPase subunit
MSDFVIETAGLRKSFKSQTALNGLDLKVPAGSIFGFLGPNGAGKTTHQAIDGHVESGWRHGQRIRTACFR